MVYGYRVIDWHFALKDKLLSTDPDVDAKSSDVL